MTVGFIAFLIILANLTISKDKEIKKPKPQKSIAEATRDGINFLKNAIYKEKKEKNKGSVALVAYALIKSDVSPEDKVIKYALDYILKEPFLVETGGYENHFAAVMIWTLSSIDMGKYKNKIEGLAGFLADKQTKEGTWGFTDPNYFRYIRPNTCVLQYAILGLSIAEKEGIKAPQFVWIKTADWLIKTQNTDGGWVCEPELNPKGESLFGMTLASIESLLLCMNYLKDSNNNIVSKSQMQYAIDAGLEWLKENWRIVPKKSNNKADHSFALYYIFDLEVVGALTGWDKIAERDWYKEGADYILSMQQEDGGWQDIYSFLSEIEIEKQESSIISTSFAILFLNRASKGVFVVQKK